MLVLEGELDLATVGEFADATSSFGAGDALVVDGTALELMDSTGLRHLLELAERLGDQLIVACPPDGHHGPVTSGRRAQSR